MIRTDRLILREWRDEDLEPFHHINSDPEVMRHISAVGGLAETAAAIERQRSLQALHGHCFWAIERSGDGVLLGFCGLRPGVPDTPIAADIEAGWRLGRAWWGQGYGREAASACFDWAFASLSVPRVVAITVPANRRSWGLMERLGMTRRPDLDFLHPTLPDGDPLKPHITYAKDRP